MKAFLQDLRRRGVVRVAVVYAVAAWLVMQVADVVAPALHLPQWTVTLVVFLSLLGFPLALVLAWLFDVTPEGLERTPAPGSEAEAESAPGSGGQAGSTAGSRRSTRAALVGGTVAGLLLALAGVAALVFVEPDLVGGGSGDAPGPLTSIAVLPFANMSADPANEYFSDGVSEELRDAMAQIPGLKVAARTSSLRFKEERPDVQEVGEALGVEAVLEGSVRKSGDRVRITAQLTGARDGYTLWSATYDRTLTDVFAVQDEIARSIVEELGVRLPDTDGGRLVEEETADPEAHILYLRGRHAALSRDESSLRQAVALFRQSLDRDPVYAPAWAGLADAHFLLGAYRFTDPEEANRQAEQAALRALELDPEMAEAYATLGILHTGRGNWHEAEAAFRRAIRLKPSYAQARDWYSLLLEILGRSEEALEQSRRAEELDPLAPPIVGSLAYLLHFRGADAAATAKGREAGNLEGNPYAMAWVPYSLASGGRLDEARDVLGEIGDDLPAHPNVAVNAAAAHALVGQEERAWSLLERMEAQGVDVAFARAAVHAAEGRADSAVAWLERVDFGVNQFFFLSLRVFDPIRDDPVFRRFRRSLGLP